MMHFTESVVVRRSVADVFAFVTDFREAQHWRTEVLRSEQTPAGPVRVGSRLREVATIAGHRVETEAVVVEVSESHRIAFRHASGPLPMSGSFTVTPVADGARLTYDLTVELHGGWVLLAPVFRITWPQRMVESLDECRFRLEASVMPLAS